MIFEKAIVNIYRAEMLKRHDPDGSVFYYSPEDFPELSVEEFNFVGSAGQRLCGYFYSAEGVRQGRIVLFEHGMGCGHRAYMREIATIVRAGYTVFAYDHTGTLASEGEHIGGLTQSLVDLNDAINALKAAGRLDSATLSVIGHSWGGFSTMNIGAFHKDITHIVAMSGYYSVERMLKSIFKGIMSGYVPAVLKSEIEAFGGYALADARYSLVTTEAKTLIIHSKDDTMADFRMFEELRATLAGRENISFLELDGKRHNPTYADDAVRYKDDFFAELTAARKKKRLDADDAKAEFVSRFDFERMTAQDDVVWQRIFEHLES